jgi:protein DGCR14
MPADVQSRTLALANGFSNAPNTWHYTPKNSLMYYPEGVDYSAKELIALSKVNRTQIKHANTRFAAEPYPATGSGAGSTRTRQSTQPGGNPHIPFGAGRGGAGAGGGSEDFGMGSDSPRVNGYGFVSTPAPAPGVNIDPLMRWGQVEGTPMMLRGPDEIAPMTPGPVFTIPQPSSREKLAQRMADESMKKRKPAASKAAKRSAEGSAGAAGETTASRLSAMSPAAQKLGRGLIKGGISNLRASYSGTPTTAPASASGTPRFNFTPRNTPRVSAGTPAASAASAAAAASGMSKIGVKHRKTAAAAATAATAMTVGGGESGSDATEESQPAASSLTDNLLM